MKLSSIISLAVLLAVTSYAQAESTPAQRKALTTAAAGKAKVTHPRRTIVKYTIRRVIPNSNSTIVTAKPVATVVSVENTASPTADNGIGRIMRPIRANTWSLEGSNEQALSVIDLKPLPLYRATANNGMAYSTPTPVVVPMH